MLLTKLSIKSNKRAITKNILRKECSLLSSLMRSDLFMYEVSSKYLKYLLDILRTKIKHEKQQREITWKLWSKSYHSCSLQTSTMRSIHVRSFRLIPHTLIYNYALDKNVEQERRPIPYCHGHCKMPELQIYM